GIMALTNAVIPWVAIGWGEERISSGLASILNSTTTLWTAVLIYWVMPTERPSFVNYIGVLVGFAGVVVLVYPEIAAHGISGDGRFVGRAGAARERERVRHRGHGGDPPGHPDRQPAPGAASRVYRRARFGRRVSHFVEEHAVQVRLAAERIHGRVRRTPTLTTDLDPDLRLKAECFQVTGSV